MQERKYAKAGEVMEMAAEKFRKGKNKSLYFSSMNEAVRYYSTAKEYAKAEKTSLGAAYPVRIEEQKILKEHCRSRQICC